MVKHDNITLPEVWGPDAWYLIHHITRNLVDKKSFDQTAVINFFSILWVFIPCAICRNHYMEHIKKDPFIHYINDGNDLDKWGFELHNNINKMLHKSIMSYETYQKQYSGPPTAPKLKRFIDIIMELHLTPDISISEIQDLKLFLKSIIILYPLVIPSKSKTTTLEKLATVYDYQTLKSFYQNQSIL